MNPDTNRFEKLLHRMPEDAHKAYDQLLEQSKGLAREPSLVRPDGSPVPKTWTTFELGEHVVIKGYTFKVAYIGETVILFEPMGPVLAGEGAAA